MGIGINNRHTLALISCTVLVYRAWVTRFSGFETAISAGATVTGFSFAVFGDGWPSAIQVAVLATGVALFALMVISQRKHTTAELTVPAPVLQKC